MTTDPARRLSSIDVLDFAERARLDEVGNRAVLTRPAPAAVSVPELFAAQVAHAPDAVAVNFGDLSMTYRELDEAANRFAHLLSGYGVGPGAGGVAVGALSPGRRGHAGRTENRGGVPGDRPSAACGPDAIHAR